jgi:hypothetical protein
MNEDRLNTTAEILDAFQGCRDAGEEIDLFEALAWRDEPPIQAFVEIVRRIKLEPVLALTVQALGWVKNAEILERWKENDELLEILSNLAKSGETDLIRWSAAWTIKLIGFDFVSTSQYLTETPDNIAKNIINRREKTESIKKDSVDFWIYGRTDFFWMSDFCTDNNLDSVEKVKEIYELKGVRGINEVNLFLIEFLKDNTPDLFNLTFACQRVSERRILSTSASSLSPRELKMLMFNQILCVSSHHAMVRRFAIRFLCSNDCPSLTKIAPGIQQAVNQVNDVTSEINNIIEEVRLDENYIDNYDTETIKKILLEDFESEIKALEVNRSNELKKKNAEINRKQQEKNKIIEETKKVSKQVTESKKSLILFFLCSPLILLIFFCASWPLCALVGGLICAVLLVKGSYIPFINGCSTFASIAMITYHAVLLFSEYSSGSEKKAGKEKIRNNIEFEESKIKQQIQRIEDRSDMEMKKIIGLKNTRIFGVDKIDDLLNKRNKTYKIVNKSVN